MKKVLTFLMFFLLATIAAQTQAEEKSIVVDANVSKVTSSYADKSFTVNSVGLGFTQWMYNDTYKCIQAKKDTPSSLYNTDPIPGKITKIEVVQQQTARAITISGGLSTKPTESITAPATAATMTFDFSGVNYRYFSLSTPSNAVYINKITVYYEEVTQAYTVTLGDNNTTLTETSAGAGVTLPSRNNVGDYTFVGWSTSNYTTESTTAPTIIKAGDYKPAANVTLYPMYKRTEGEDNVLSQTLQYDSWTYGGSTTDKSSYRLFHSGGYIESAEFDLSKLAKVIVYGGTFGGASYNKLTIGDGTKTWKSVTVSGSSQTGINTFTDGSSLTGTGKLRITSNSGTSSSTGVRISKVEIYISTLVDYYISTPVAPVVKTETTTAFAVETVTKTVGEADFTEAATLTPAEAGSLTYSSSNTGVATVDAATGLVHIVAAGNTTIKAEYAGNADYEASSDSYTLTVNAATLNSIAITGTLTKTEYKVGEAFSTEGLTVTGTYSDASKAPITDGITWTVSPETFTAAGNVNVTVTATVGELTAETRTFEVTVTEAPTPGTGDFTLVTSASDLVAGREYIIATSKADGECKAMGTINGTNTYATAVPATVENNTIASTDEMAIVTLGGAEGAWTLHTSQGYLNNSNNAKNTLKASETSNSTAKIELGNDGKFTITFDHSGTSDIYNKLQFNASSPRFACYTGTQQNVYLYYREGAAPTPTVAAPVVTPESGLQTAGFKVTASCATTGAKIYYKYNEGEDTEYTTELDGQAGTYKFWATLDVEGGETLISEVVERTYTVKNLTGITLSGYYTALNVGDEFAFGGKVYALYEGSTDKVEVTKVAVFEREDFNKDVPGTYTITVSYTEGDNTQTATYDVKVVDEFNIIIAQPANGILVVKNNATDDVVNSGDKLPVGTVLKVEATPATDYLYNFWQVYTDKHTITKYPGKETDTYKLDAKNIKSEARAVFQANFREVETFTYSWYANGELVGTTNEGEDVTVPTAPAKLGDKGFMGWVTTSTVDPNNAPTYVDVYNLSSPTSNKKFYAVYATAPEEGVETSSDYYVKVDPGYDNWLDGEYILVYEGGTYGSGTGQRKFGPRAFNGEASGASITTLGNHAEVTITTKDGKSVVENAPSTVATITFSKPGSYMHMMSNKANYVYYNNGQTGSLAIDPGTDASLQREKKEYGYEITWNGDRCNVKVNGSNYLGFRTTNQTIETNDFRIGSSETTNAAIWFYKKVAGYSGFTTGVNASKGEFKLVKSTDDLVNGREYIIVSKHDSGIYGLSIDDADSRQNTKYDDEGQEIPITEGKTSKDHRRAVKDVTLYNDDEYASINGLTSVLTLERDSKTEPCKFNSAAGYLTMPKEDACLQLSATPSTAIVSVDDNNSKSVVKFNATTNRYIFLNFNDGYPRFSTYGAGSNGWQYGKDVYLYYREALNEETLAEIEANGIDGTVYTISDELEVVAVEGNTAWVKDNANSYAFRENTYGASVYNYRNDEYAQNNWIQLNFDDNAPAKGSILTGVKGTYNGYKDRKHELNNIDPNTYTVKQGETGSYSLNTYTMASFWNDNIYDYAVATTGKKFFLMNPKMMEVCTVTDAIWAGNNTFVVPAAGEEAIVDGQTIHLNTANFKGQFKVVDWSHNTGGEDVTLKLDEALNNNAGKRITFTAVVYKQDASKQAPAKVAGMNPAVAQDSYFVAIPLDLRLANDNDNIVTAVDDVNAAKSVKSVRYYNVAGHAFDEAQPGVNIVVTEYTDGSHTAAKVLR